MCIFIQNKNSTIQLMIWWYFNYFVVYVEVTWTIPVWEWPDQGEDGEDDQVTPAGRGYQGRAPPSSRESSGVSSDDPSVRTVCYSRAHGRRKASHRCGSSCDGSAPRYEWRISRSRRTGIWTVSHLVETFCNDKIKICRWKGWNY